MPSKTGHQAARLAGQDSQHHRPVRGVLGKVMRLGDDQRRGRWNRTSLASPVRTSTSSCAARRRACQQMGEQARKAGGFIEEGAVQKLKELRDRSEEAKSKWDAFWAVPVATLETRIQERKAAIVEELQDRQGDRGLRHAGRQDQSRVRGGQGDRTVDAGAGPGEGPSKWTASAACAICSGNSRHLRQRGAQGHRRHQDSDENLGRDHRRKPEEHRRPERQTRRDEPAASRRRAARRLANLPMPGCGSTFSEPSRSKSKRAWPRNDAGHSADQCADRHAAGAAAGHAA